jgi:hypothetical protein
MTNKEFVEYLLDDVESVFEPLQMSSLKGLSIEDKARVMAEHENLGGAAMQVLVAVALRRPDALKKRKKLWDTSQDVIQGIESGVLPKPSWYEAAKA